MNRQRLHLISCRVFKRELDLLSPTAKTDLSIQHLEMALHEKPGNHLREALQTAVDAVSPAQADAVALGYGLCNRGLVGLQARTLPVVIPRAHDCLGILLGSTARYLAEMNREPGTYFQSSGWIEHLPADRTLRPLAAGTDGVFAAKKEALIARYGEENAEFLLEELTKFTRHYKRLAYVSTPVNGGDERADKAAKIAQEQGWQFENLTGDIGWLRRMLDGDWSEKEFLILKPGERVVMRYDGLLIGAEPAA